MQSRRAVVEYALEHRTRAFAKALHARGDDFSAHRGGLAEFHIANGDKLPPIFVAPWRVQQEITDGVQFDPREQTRALRADANRRERQGERKFRRYRHDGTGYSGTQRTVGSWIVNGARLWPKPSRSKHEDCEGLLFCRKRPGIYAPAATGPSDTVALGQKSLR